MSPAAVLTFAGSQLNIDSTADDGPTIGWHTTGTAVGNVKPLDIDGDNALGSDGWIRANNGASGVNNPRRFLPDYIVPYNRTTFETAALLGFANSVAGVMDNPATGGLNLNPATEDAFAAWHSNNANNADLFAFTIQNVNLLAGEILRVGVLFDASNGGTGSQVMSLTQTAGGTATATSISLAHAGDGLDVAFFDLTGLSNGDRFVIAADSTARSHIAGVTFDSATPEPSTAVLWSLGLLAMLRRRR